MITLDWPTLWTRYAAVYGGRDHILASGLFPQNPMESSEKYELRKRLMHHMNYSRTIISLYTDHMLGVPFARNLGKLTNDERFQRFMLDCDGAGLPYQDFIRLWAGTCGAFGTIYLRVRKLNPRETVADELASGSRVVLDVITPDRLNELPEYTRLDSGQYQVSKLSYTDEFGDLVTVNKDELVVWQNLRSDDVRFGRSDIADIASIDLSIMHNLSALDMVLAFAGNPMLRVPMDADPGSLRAAPDAVYKTDNPELPSWIATEVKEPVESLLEAIAMKVESIYRIAQAGGVHAQFNRYAPTGKALQVSLTSLNAVLARKAAMLAQAETRLLHKVADLLNVDREGISVQAPTEFNTQAAVEDLASLMETDAFFTTSPTYRQELRKRIARSVLSQVPLATLQDVERELEAPLPVPVQTAGHTDTDQPSET